MPLRPARPFGAGTLRTYPRCSTDVAFRAARSVMRTRRNRKVTVESPWFCRPVHSAGRSGLHRPAFSLGVVLRGRLGRQSSKA